MKRERRKEQKSETQKDRPKGATMGEVRYLNAPQGAYEGEKLYRIHSTVDGWKDRYWFYDGVTITWLARRQAEARYRLPWVEEPLVDLGIGGKDVYLACLVNELITREEAEAFIAYLKECYGNVTASMWEHPTPVPANSVGLGVMPLGGGVERCVIRWKEGYPFDFEVQGYYDRRHLEPTRREPFRECATAGCSEDGVRIWRGPNDESYEKDEEGWVHQCKRHYVEDVRRGESGAPPAASSEREHRP